MRRKPEFSIGSKGLKQALRQPGFGLN